jgi:allantoinase
MSDADLIIRNGAIVTPSGLITIDICVAVGKIAAIDQKGSGTAREEIDATGLHIFPGVIDSHVHFNEPGRADWEGIETGSRALAAGGGTMFFDMPLNAHPPTIDANSFDQKLAAAEKKSLVDFALWGGLIPGNLYKLDELADRGVVGFKAFMSNSGIEDFPCVEDRTLREGMKRAAQLKLPVAVHAESETMTRQLAQERIAKKKTSVRDYLESRPVEAELEAIRRALDLAGETHCKLHIVHVSSGEGVRVITEARRRGVDVSCETCPHYLMMMAADMERLGAIAKCAPPLRPSSEQKKLWLRLLAGEITTIGSDHSPSPPDMKTDSDFFKVWGGISGAQHTLPILLNDGHFNRGMTLAQISNLLSSNVAERFSLPKTKGRIETGCDADLALVNLNEQFEVRNDDLFYRHKQSPYIGRRLQGKVVRTLLRGETVFLDGKIIAKPSGHLVKPVR